MHIAALRDGLIEAEARRIVREMKRQYSPNSPNKTHFMVELSPAFMQLASTKDTDRLFLHAALQDTFLFQNRGQTWNVCAD